MKEKARARSEGNAETAFSRKGSRRSTTRAKSAFAFSSAEEGKKPGELIRQGTLKVRLITRKNMSKYLNNLWLV